MPSKFRSVQLAAAVCGVVAITASTSLAQNPNYLPLPASAWAKNDIALGTSVSQADRTIKQVKADLGVKDSGNVTTLAYGQTFIQSVEFDNYNGIRHNATGNLLGVNFGTAAAGGSLSTFATRGIMPGQATPAASAPLFTFNIASTGEATNTRVGGLSVSPVNNRIGLSTGDVAGKAIVMDYTAAPGTAVGAAVSNYRSIAIPGLVGTNITSWQDNSNLLVIGNDTANGETGNLHRVTVATDGTLSQTRVATNVFSGFGLNFTNVTYEPTVSPFVFVSGSGLIASTTVNRLIVLDPANSFTPITSLLNFSPTGAAGTPDGEINTLRETAFDSKGNLLMGAFAGSSALSDEYILKGLMSARSAATLVDNDPRLKGILKKQQTSVAASTATPPIFGTSSSFNGNDVAITNLDLINADVGINIETGDYTQQYFGASPKAALLAKLNNGKLVGTAAPSRGIGYSITPGIDGGTFRVVYTVPGDADLNKTVEFQDLVSLAQNYNGVGKVYAEGDFNYDETVGFADLVILAQNYNLSASTEDLIAAGLSADFAADWALAQSMVPEPTTLAALAGVIGVATRRRR